MLRVTLLRRLGNLIESRVQAVYSTYVYLGETCPNVPSINCYRRARRKQNFGTFVEPVGFKSPTFSTDDSLSAFLRREGTNVTLACNAQGSPVPKAR